MLFEAMSRLSPGQLIGLVAVAGGLMVAVVAVVMDYRHKLEVTALKREMVQRGMTAEEIQGVVNAGMSCKRKEESSTPA